MRRAVLVLGLLLVAGAWRPASAQDDFRWRGNVPNGKAIEIKGVHGSIRAEPASGDEVEVVAEKRARKSDPASVTIEVLQHDGGVTICAVYPTPAPRQSRSSRSSSNDGPNVCRPGEEGRMNTRMNDVQVDFTVRVPRRVLFVGRTINGQIEARSLEERAEAYSVNGPITISSRGIVTAETVNGSIDATLGRADWTGTLDFRTVNGTITVSLPGDTNTSLRADTHNGHVSSDFPMTITSLRHGSRRVAGTIGKGGRDLRLSTINGEIRVKKT
jgi:hypothetical protein